MVEHGKVSLGTVGLLRGIQGASSIKSRGGIKELLISSMNAGSYLHPGVLSKRETHLHNTVKPRKSFRMNKTMYSHSNMDMSAEYQKHEESGTRARGGQR